MTIKSIAEFLDPKNSHRPTSAERKLIAATQAGEPCRLWQGAGPGRPKGPSDDTTIRATLLRLLILGGTKDCGLHERGVWLEAGWIEGELDLSFCTGKGAALLAYCHFSDRPNLTQTTLPQLSLANSAFPGLFAQGAQIAGSLFADEVTAKGTVDVAGAKIGGQLSFTFATLDGGKDGQGTALKALNAQGVEVGDSLFLRQITATGTVWAASAIIDGQLDCEGAILNGGEDGHGNALDALNAQGVEVGASLFLRLVTASGTVDLNAAKIGAQMDCDRATLDGGKDGRGTALKALNAEGVEVGNGLLLRRVTTMGTVDMTGAKIGGQLTFSGAILNGGKDGHGNALKALTAQGVQVGHDLILYQVTSMGTADVAGAKIGGQLALTGATLNGGKDGRSNALYALNAQGLVVSQSFLFRGLASVEGRIDLTTAHVRDLVDDVTSWPSATDNLTLDGFTYDQIGGGGPTSFAARKNWLRVGSHWQGDFRPQPYTQLAKVLRQMGHAGEARKVLIERERLLAVHRLESDRKDFRAAYDGGVMSKGDSGKIWLRMRGAQFWAWLTGKVAGYGYAPQRALYCALACIGGSFFAYMLFWQLGAMVPTDAVILTSVEWQSAFDLDGLRPALVWADPSRSGPATSHYETYYSLPYALDVFLPIVDLGQQSTWGQTTVTNLGVVARIYTWLLQAAGYIITSLGLAAATGIIQRNQPD